MRYSEWLAFAYFVYLGAAACVGRLPRARRAALVAIAVGSLLAILAVGHGAIGMLRDWAPAAYVLVGYFASGLLATTPSPRFEAWLVGWDRRCLGDPTRFSAWPRWWLAYLEIIYMGCFLLIPAGFAALVWYDHRALADRFWLMVLAAEFGAFASLAFVEARPPWALEGRAALPDRAVHRVASEFVRHFTIGVNTFPSGHVAGSLAVGFAVVGVLPWTGALLLALAASIAVACVAGRYHYVLDVVAGAALAAGAWAMALALHV